MVLVLLEQKCAFKLLGFPDEDELTVQLEALPKPVSLSPGYFIHCLCSRKFAVFEKRLFIIHIVG
jgi:hypothetical protein